MLDKETKRQIVAASTLGGTGLPVVLSRQCLTRICARIAADLQDHVLVAEILVDENIPDDYYLTDPLWFEGDALLGFEECFEICREAIPDFMTYFRCLCELHKRRRKFGAILSRQGFAEVSQIAPRALLEYGKQSPLVLGEWLVWRKWLYDIDNRSAQETGYLFEPILASALGGVSYGASKSPIKRTDQPSKGRQADCIIRDVQSGVQRVYEFKLRVTIAASGQGRFSEEVSFAGDCRASGYTPVLIVLDPTSNVRLAELRRAFLDNGGEVYLGEAAWKHLEAEAGNTMAVFLERYVRIPLTRMQEVEPRLSEISLTHNEDSVVITVAGHSIEIDRRVPSIPADIDENTADDPTSSFESVDGE